MDPVISIPASLEFIADKEPGKVKSNAGYIRFKDKIGIPVRIGWQFDGNLLKLTEREIQRGEWVEVKKYNRKGKKFLDCSVCHYGEHGDIVCEVSKLPNFCPACGLPMTDEAVEILKKREAI